MNRSLVLSRSEREQLGAQVLSGWTQRKPFLVFGTTVYAATIAREAVKLGHAPVAFVDDTKAGTAWQGSPVIALADADTQVPIISAVIEGRPRTVHELLDRRGFRDISSYFDLNLADPGRFPIPFAANNVADVRSNGPKYEWLRSLLADDTSRRTLEDLLALRVEADFMGTGLRYHLQDQYWEPFLDLSQVKCFVDAGSFDGRTTLEFMERNPSYERVDVFEPVPESMQQVRRNLEGRKGVHLHPFAVLDRPQELIFTTDNGSANRISGEGDLKVMGCALDDELAGVRPDLIKLDIEGAEPLAIEGAKELIRMHRPMLAICVYHDQSHYWQVPERVLAIRSDYTVHLRHYTEGIYESVMYFV